MVVVEGRDRESERDRGWGREREGGGKGGIVKSLILTGEERKVREDGEDEEKGSKKLTRDRGSEGREREGERRGGGREREGEIEIDR